jgi:hypothetical protein
MALVDGAKTIEVRTWATKHRGPLVICASATPKNWFWRNEATNELLLIPSGCILGIVDLIDCRPMTKVDEDGAFCDVFAGAFAWVVKPIAHCRPDAILGKLNLFDVADNKLVRLDEATESIFDFEPPQGEVKFSSRCLVLE